MIEIDGAYGEGGGQILRTSLTLSALTGSSLEIHHIRSNRNQPGLRAQHLTAVNALVEITQGRVSGGARDSTSLTFEPKDLRSGRYRFQIPTAGALTLVIQTVFLPLSYAEGSSEVTLEGGTHVKWSPCFHYLEEQWLPAMEMLGFRAQLSLRKAGFYPGGGGEVYLRVLPRQELQPFTCLYRGTLAKIRGFSGVANLPDSIAKRQKHQALKRLYPLCQNTKIKTIRMPSPGKGTFILLKASFSQGGNACYSALGAPGKPAEAVADEAVEKMLLFLRTNGCVDEFLADQLLLPLSVIEKTSRFRTNQITQHLLTNAYVIRQFFPAQIKIEGALGNPGSVNVSGKRLVPEQ